MAESYFVHQVDLGNAPILDRVIAIHNEMPLAWNPSHGPSEEHLKKFRETILAESARHQVWVLSRAREINDLDPQGIEGMLWAARKQDISGAEICSVNSFWISPALRGMGLAPRLGEVCREWAKASGLVRVECATHSNNRRMRDILEQLGFKPAMVYYELSLGVPS